MNTIHLGKSELRGSEIVLGCMRIDDMSVTELAAYIDSARSLGINHFDHADIYGGGVCETQFGKVLAHNPNLREQIIIQSKSSIRDGYYDLSKDYTIQSVDSILKRLQTDYLDLFILHRPDTLMDPQEIAEAFDQLQKQGKVRHFGVSNMNSMQIELLKTAVNQPLLVNQLQFSLKNSGMIDTGIQTNTNFEGAISKAGHILEYSRIHQMTIQAWSPLQYGFFEGVFVDSPLFPELNKVLEKLATQYQVSKSAIAIAWILRHPAKMQTIVGTTNPERLKSIAQAGHVKLTRQEWYQLYTAAGNMLP